MIIGIGIDLVECGRFADWSDFKKQRIFTKYELEYAANNATAGERHLANFWAAREAVLKAMGIGFGEGINFSDVSITHDELGKPELLVVGGALSELKKIANNGFHAHVSITDQGDYSAAVVVIETKN
jgi:holo-[acyl-carrier protein] synthase